MSGIAAVLLFLPERELQPVAEKGVRDEEPQALVGKARGLAALAQNEFPRQLNRPCACNARALIWSKDKTRRSAWIGSCRRCAAPRLDVVSGVALER